MLSELSFFILLIGASAVVLLMAGTSEMEIFTFSLFDIGTILFRIEIHWGFSSNAEGKPISDDVCLGMEVGHVCE